MADEAVGRNKQGIATAARPERRRRTEEAEEGTPARARAKAEPAPAPAPLAPAPAAPTAPAHVAVDESPVAKEAALNLKKLKEKKIGELAQLAKNFNIEGAANMRKQELIFAILGAQT